MLSKECTPEILQNFEEDMARYALEANVCGSFLIHKKESLFYISGVEEMVYKMLDFMQNSEALTLINTLHTGNRHAICDGVWEIIESNMFIEKLELSQKESVGLKLFTSVAEIILSEKLYGFE